MIALLTIFATVFVIYYAFHQGLPFVHRFTLHAYVSNSVNVRQDSPVRIAGIDVGKVENTTPSGRATEINLTLDSSGQPVHKDATIRIRDRLFLEGGYYLELDPGSPTAPVLHDGGVIPQSQTATPVQFYNLLSTFDAPTRSSLEHILTEFDAGFSAGPGQAQSESGAGGLKRAIPQLTPVTKDIALVSGSLRGTQQGDVQRLLSSAASFTSTLAGSSAQLADLATSLNRASGGLAASDGALAQSLAGLDQTLHVAPGSLSAVDRALPPLVNLASALDPGLKVAPPILSGITSAVRQLAAIVAPVERGRLLTTLRAAFEQFPTLLTKQGSAFPITKAVSDCLNTHVLPILTSVVPDGALSTGQPVWKDFVHFLVGLASSAQNFDANGYWIRLLVGAGANTVSLGNIPGVGSLVGEAPSNNPIQGARPAWFGDLTANEFHPEAPCARQPVPSLASSTAAPDVRATHVQPSTAHMSVAQLAAAFRRAASRANGVSAK